MFPTPTPAVESNSNSNLVAAAASVKPMRRRSTIDEKKDRRPELINSVPRYYLFSNDRLTSQAYSALIKAQTCWLSAPEILTLLDFAKECKLCAQTPHRPNSGSIFYYDSRSGVCFRRDGYSYIKKKGSAISVREDHVKLRIGNVAVIYASYVHSAEHHTLGVEQASLFHRRSYWLVNSSEKERGVIVHYLSSGEGSGAIEPSRPHDDASCECMLCAIRRVQVPPGLEDRALTSVLARCPPTSAASNSNTAGGGGATSGRAGSGSRDFDEGEEKQSFQHYHHHQQQQQPVMLQLDEEDASVLELATTPEMHAQQQQHQQHQQSHHAGAFVLTPGLNNEGGFDDEFDPYDPDDMAYIMLPPGAAAAGAGSSSSTHEERSVRIKQQSTTSQQQQANFMQPFKPPPPQQQQQSYAANPGPLPTSNARMQQELLLQHQHQQQQLQQQQQQARRGERPPVRFEAANLCIVEYAPSIITRTSGRILLNLGMHKCPESLNYRTWVEKVVPRLSVSFAGARGTGIVLVSEIEAVSLGVLRFHCPAQVDETCCSMVLSFDLGASRGLIPIPLHASLPPMRFDLRGEAAGSSSNMLACGSEGEEEEVDEDVELDRKATVMVERVVRELLKNHASVEALNETSSENGFNFLHTVVFCSGSLELVELLLQHGSAVNLKTRCELGNTALHFAVENGSAECAALLLRYGADATLANNQGQSALDLVMDGSKSADMLRVFEGYIRQNSSSNSRGAWRTSSPSAGSTSSEYAGAVHMQMLRHSLGALSVSDQATLAMAVDHRKSSCADLEEYLDDKPSPPPPQQQQMAAAVPAMAPSPGLAPQQLQQQHLPESAPEMDVDQLVTEAQPKIYEMMRTTMNAHELAVINKEAIKIQSNVRAWILRKKFAETQDAATKIQALAKGHLARKDFRDLKDKVTHTMVIQKCFRRHREAQRLLREQQQQQQAGPSPQLAPVMAVTTTTTTMNDDDGNAPPPPLVDNHHHDDYLLHESDLFLSLD